MNKEDWIILRTLMVAAKHEPHNPDVARAILHLTKRHGTQTVLDCIKQLRTSDDWAEHKAAEYDKVQRLNDGE